MRIVMTIALAAGLALIASRAHAIWIEAQLTPENIARQDQSFTVNTRDIEGMKEFRISVAPKEGKEISPFTSGELMVIEEDHHVATVPVSASRAGKKVTFRFRVSSAAAARSRFDLREQGWTDYRNADGTPQRNEDGTPKVEMTLGGQAFWFWLRDFVGQAASG